MRMMRRFKGDVGMDGVIKAEAGEFAGLNVKPIGDRTATDVEIIKYLAKNGFDKAFGARPLKRLIETEITDKVAMLLLDKEESEISGMVAEIKNGKIVVELGD